MALSVKLFLLFTEAQTERSKKEIRMPLKDDVRMELLQTVLERFTRSINREANDSIFFRDQLKVLKDGFKNLSAQVNAWTCLISLGSISSVPDNSLVGMQGVARSLYREFIVLEMELFRAKAEIKLVCGGVDGLVGSFGERQLRGASKIVIQLS